ncbi:conjugal transfer protein [Enterococcus sp. S157_ASV_20]|nr:conjugal transfer protein [Enterococcus sp. S157_ASV_20]
MVVKEKVINTSGVESFTKNFVKEYFSWKNNKEVIEKRMSNLGQYLTEEGLALSQDMVRVDIPTSSEVNSVKILDVEKRSKDFVVSFLVDQKITEGKKSEQISSAYRVKIFEDEKENHIVTSLPTMISKPGKAKYEVKQVESDSDIDAKTTQEITEFLETFFKLYPTASEKELEYYSENESMSQVSSDLRFVEITNPIYLEKDGSVQVKIVVKYLNEIEKVTNSFQYNLLLNKEENWKIINGE